ncbi:hypothetical protein D3C87_1179060 [compost metagenome]
MIRDKSVGIPSTNIKGASDPLIVPAPRILIVAARLMFPELKLTFTPGVVPCNALLTSVKGLLPIVLATSIDATAPVKLVFF